MPDTPELVHDFDQRDVPHALNLDLPLQSGGPLLQSVVLLQQVLVLPQQQDVSPLFYVQLEHGLIALAFCCPTLSAARFSAASRLFFSVSAIKA